MLTVLFTILMIVVFGKLFVLALKGAWGITKIMFTLIFLPFILIGMVLGKLIMIALPVLLLIGLLSFAADAQ